MPSPVEKFKLPRGMGRLIRHTVNGVWSWISWCRRRKKWITESTGEVNRSRAEQYVYQQCALRHGKKFQYLGDTVLFDTVAEEYIAAREEGRDCKRLRSSSLLKLAGAVKAFRSFIGDGYDALHIAHVDATVLKQFVDHEVKRMSIGAANRSLAFIVQVLKFALRRECILQVPKVSVLCEQVSDGDGEQAEDGIEGSPVPTAKEIRLIIENASVQLKPTGCKTRHQHAIYTGINQNDYSNLYAVLCLTGMRIGEACHLIWADVDLGNKIILIRPGNKNGKYWQPKTKFGIRRIPIVPELEVIFKRLRKTNRRKEWVFETHRGTQTHAHNVSKRFRQICDGLGFKQHYVVHSLRKYWASTVAQQGMHWQIMIKMFGHGDFKLILTTYYAQNDDARLLAEASKIDFGLALPKTA